MEITIKECIEFLKSNDNYLIFTHAAPDADTLGSGLALKYALEKSGKQVKLYNPDSIPARLGFLTEGTEVFNRIPKGEYTLVSVDIASPAMLKGLDREYLENLVFDLSIDHHDIHSVNPKRLLAWAISRRGGNYRGHYKADGVPFDKTNSLWMYAAISADSGVSGIPPQGPKPLLRRPNCCKPVLISQNQPQDFRMQDQGQLALEKDAYDNLESFFDGKVAIVCLSDRVLDLDYVDENDVDQINNIPRQIADVEVSALIRRYGDEIKVSFRSNDYYDVAALAKSFGGGGHIHAAGCRFKTSVKDAKEKILEALKKDFENTIKNG